MNNQISEEEVKAELGDKKEKRKHKISVGYVHAAQVDEPNYGSFKKVKKSKPMKIQHLANSIAKIVTVISEDF